MAGKRAWLPILVASGLVATAVWTLRSDSSRFAIARDYARLERVWSEHWPLDRGKGALLRAAPLLSSIGVIPVRAELEPGVRLLLDPRDIIERAILRDGQWEPAVWRAISGNLRDGAVFLDAGAHIGYFSIRSAVRVGKSGRVVAFEPNPKTLTRLRENVTASDAANVSIQPIACTDREQVVTLYEGPADNTGTTSLSKENAGAFASRRKPAGSSFVVRGRRIDDVVRELGFERVDVMKVDGGFA